MTVEMKLHILSDVHTEFADFTPPDVDADIVECSNSQIAVLVN
tara:strand:- start:16504 stop:16632 length:129 start_codon:yes stop_codon:yes gene_type:complete